MTTSTQRVAEPHEYPAPVAVDIAAVERELCRIPEVRDELYFDTPGGSLKFTIRKASARQIEAVVVDKLPLPPKAD